MTPIDTGLAQQRGRVDSLRFQRAGDDLSPGGNGVGAWHAVSPACSLIDPRYASGEAFGAGGVHH